MGLFDRKKLTPADEKLIACSACVFRIESAIFPNIQANGQRIAHIGGRLLKGTLHVGDEIVTEKQRCRIQNIQKGFDPLSSISTDEYVGLTVTYELLNSFLNPLKKGVFPIVCPSAAPVTPPPPSIAHKEHKTYTCARCKKVITDDESKWIGSHRFCRACGMAAAKPTPKPTPQTTHQPPFEADRAAYQVGMDISKGGLSPDEAYALRGFVKNPDGQWVYPGQNADTTFVCAKCGKTLAFKYHHANNVCADCYVASPPTPPPAPYCITTEKEHILQKLRKQIIADIRKKPSTTYELASLLWGDAARCFPTNYSFSWDGAWFKLDLESGKLYADVSTYPNQFGATRDERYPLTPAAFCQKGKEFAFGGEWVNLDREEDWAALFDDQLKAAIARSKVQLQKEHESKQEANRIAYGVVLADTQAQPKMNIEEIRLELHQRYGSSRVRLTQEANHYRISGRNLTPAEARWAEERVGTCLQNPGTERWQSMLGGDQMRVYIRRQHHAPIDIPLQQPTKKYIDLLHDLEKLARYGSTTEAEKKQHKS